MTRSENQFGRPEIPSRELVTSDIPSIGQEYSPAIVEFALTFDGYQRYSPEALFKIKDHAQAEFVRDRSLPKTVKRARVCLFAHQRMWRDSEGPDEMSLEFILALVGRIRQVVAGRRVVKQSNSTRTSSDA